MSFTLGQQQLQQHDPGLGSHYIGGIGDWLRYHAGYRPQSEALVYHARFLPLLEPIRDATTGTTGKPKGALLTHSNPSWVAINTQMSPLAFSASDSTLTVAPLFHIGGLAIYTLPMLYCGVRIVLQPQFEPENLLKTLEKERIATLFLLPSMWLMLSQWPDFDDYDLSSLKVLMSGGAPCPITVIEFFQKRGFQFLEGFGMTETCASACVLNNENAVRKNGSVGKSLIHVQMRIVDVNDNDVAPGDTGELVLRGPSMFRAYWNRPDATPWMKRTPGCKGPIRGAEEQSSAHLLCFEYAGAGKPGERRRESSMASSSTTTTTWQRRS